MYGKKPETPSRGRTTAAKQQWKADWEETPQYKAWMAARIAPAELKRLQGVIDTAGPEAKAAGERLAGFKTLQADAFRVKREVQTRACSIAASTGATVPSTATSAAAAAASASAASPAKH
jgi:hypothetical protein